MPAQRIRQRKRKEALLKSKANTADQKSTQFNHIAPDRTRDASQPALAFNVHACLDWEGFYINLSPIVLLVMLQLWAIMDTTTHPITTDSGAQLSGAINALAESAVELAPSWPFPDSGFDSYAQGLAMESAFNGLLNCGVGSGGTWGWLCVPQGCKTKLENTVTQSGITNGTGYYHQIVLPLRECVPKRPLSAFGECSVHSPTPVTCGDCASPTPIATGFVCSPQQVFDTLTPAEVAQLRRATINATRDDQFKLFEVMELLQDISYNATGADWQANVLPFYLAEDVDCSMFQNATGEVTQTISRGLCEKLRSDVIFLRDYFANRYGNTNSTL